MVQMAEALGGPTARALERKREILEGAARVFRRAGLASTGMREIAAELGMHAGNLYYYFRNKEELLAFCQEDALEGLLELAEEVERSGEPADRRLARLVEGHVRLLNERTPGSLAHLEVEALSGRWRRRIQTRRDRYERQLRDLIAEGMESGIFRPGDPRVAAMAILGAVNWTVKWFRAGGGKAAAQIGREFAEILVGGLLAAPARPPTPAPTESDRE